MHEIPALLLTYTVSPVSCQTTKCHDVELSLVPFMFYPTTNSAHHNIIVISYLEEIKSLNSSTIPQSYLILLSSPIPVRPYKTMEVLLMGGEDTLCVSYLVRVCYR